MEYAQRQSPSKITYYRRRKLKGLEPHCDGKTFLAKSTDTTEPKLAAASLIKINTQAERDWSRLCQG